MDLKIYNKVLLKEFILFYKEFKGSEKVLHESELDLIDLFLGEKND